MHVHALKEIKPRARQEPKEVDVLWAKGYCFMSRIQAVTFGLHVWLWPTHQDQSWAQWKGFWEKCRVGFLTNDMRAGTSLISTWLARSDLVSVLECGLTAGYRQANRCFALLGHSIWETETFVTTSRAELCEAKPPRLCECVKRFSVWSCRRHLYWGAHSTAPNPSLQTNLHHMCYIKYHI